jgi:riboflavin kinase/FMN adenylyltransferase
LSVLDEKQKLLEKYGIDYLVLLPFNKSFSNWTAEKFVRDILIKKVNAKKVIIGYNHKFGNNREGDINYLINEGNKYGFEVEEISKQLIDEISISSTKVRNLLTKGEIDNATKLLGHHYSFSGNIVHGEKVGKSIGFPTANIKPNNKHKLIPCEGVYAIEAIIENDIFKGMLHIGTKPSLNSSKYTIEAHIFDFDKDIYHKEITIKLIKFLRRNMKFESLGVLKQQLNEDKIRSKKILSSLT